MATNTWLDVHSAARTVLPRTAARCSSPRRRGASRDRPCGDLAFWTLGASIKDLDQRCGSHSWLVVAWRGVPATSHVETTDQPAAQMTEFSVAHAKPKPCHARAHRLLTLASGGRQTPSSCRSRPASRGVSAGLLRGPLAAGGSGPDPKTIAVALGVREQPDRPRSIRCRLTSGSASLVLDNFEQLRRAPRSFEAAQAAGARDPRDQPRGAPTCAAKGVPGPAAASLMRSSRPSDTSPVRSGARSFAGRGVVLTSRSTPRARGGGGHLCQAGRPPLASRWLLHG